MCTPPHFLEDVGKGGADTCQAAAVTEMDMVLALEGRIVSWGSGSSQ